MKSGLFSYAMGVAALMTLWFLLPLHHSVAAQKGSADTPDCADAAPNQTCVYTGKAPFFPLGNWCIGCSKDGKTTPRMPDGHPDLSGFYDRPFVGTVTRRADGTIGYSNGDIRHPSYARPTTEPRPDVSEPSYKPEYAAKVKDIVEHTAVNAQETTPLDPLQQCKPLGVPRVMEPPFDIVQTPNRVVILYEPDEVGNTFRIIYTDGRPHPKDIDTTYLGDSIGHWEGNTLVVDVIGLNDETWLGGEGSQRGKYALMHSDQEHVIERYTRNGDDLSYEATVEDPVMLTKPWVITPRHFHHMGPGFRLLGDSYCQNHDLEHFVPPAEWQLSVQGPQGKTTQTLLLVEDSQLATGENTLTGSLDDNDIAGTKRGENITFSVKVQTPNGPVTREFVGTITGESMKGTVKTGENQQEWTATKVKK